MRIFNCHNSIFVYLHWKQESKLTVDENIIATIKICQKNHRSVRVIIRTQVSMGQKPYSFLKLANI